MTGIAPTRTDPARITRTTEDPVFLDPSGRRQQLLERVLVVLLVASLLLIGTAGCALL